MRTGNIIGLILGSVLLCWSGCQEPMVSTNAVIDGDGIAVTDFRGKEIYVQKPVERAVCLIESAFSGLCMLGAQDRVVGVPGDVYKQGLWKYYSMLDERIAQRSLPTPGNWEFLSLEQVAGLEPDLVIVWASQAEAIDNLERLGFPVYAIMLHSFEDVFKEMQDLGKLFGRGDRADSLIQYTKGLLEGNRTRYATTGARRAYFMWAQGINETAGKNSTVQELFEYARVENVCRMPAEHVTVSLERLVEWDPEMIVMWHNGKLDPEDILGNPLLKGVEAVQQGLVFELPGVFFCDFWTLKMAYPVKLVSGWAYERQDLSSENSAYLENMLDFLYGMDIMKDE